MIMCVKSKLSTSAYVQLILKRHISLKPKFKLCTAVVIVLGRLIKSVVRIL